MRPLKLSLSGFIGIKSGLGLDEFTLDIEARSGDAALVALIGPNGAGKSTVMDNLHPYRLMPSRAGGYSPGSFSFYDHTVGEAKKELDWEHDGQRYRSTLLIKQTAKTKKTEAYLFVADGIEWIPASIADGTVSDGKADTYDRIVDAICGTPEMFFTSAFSAQGRRSLSSYANGEIKGLLSELLGLDHIRAIGERAKDEAKERKMKLDAQREALNKIDTGLAELEAADMQCAISKASLVHATADRELARTQVTAAARSLADLQAVAAGNNEIEARRAALKSRLLGVTDRVRKSAEQAQEDMRAETQAGIKARMTISADIDSMNAQIRAAQAQIVSAQATQGKTAALEAARLSAPILADDLLTASNAVESARLANTAKQNLATKLTGDSNTLAGIIREGKQLAEQLGSLSQRAKLIDTVPCANIELECECPLLADAIAAQTGIPQATTIRDAARATYHKMHAEQEALKAEIAALGDTAAALAKALDAERAATAAVQANNAVLALAPAIEQADQIIVAAQSSIDALTAQVATKQAASIQSDEESAVRIFEMKKRLDEAHAALHEEANVATFELDSLPPPADTSALAAAELALQSAERSLSESDQAVSGLNARIGALTERIATLQRDLAGAAEAKTNAAALEDDIAQWTLLSRALGNDGIIALSIDDAGPTLAAYCNDLLLSCYGPRFSVSIQTQATTAKGDMKETFDIRVFDGETGDDKSVRDMSGGQKIYINEALTRAIALYQAEMHGRHYECLFADESDGALDPERKIQFMRMKRKVLELGGYKSEIFISHTPELWGMADAVINLEDFRA